MPRQRLTPGSVGGISVVPLGIGPDGTESVIPAPLTDGGEVLRHQKGLKAGSVIKVLTNPGVAEYHVTRWRGLCRVVDVDDATYMVRRWRDTRAAAEGATRDAARQKLAKLATARGAAVKDAARAVAGDTTTTVSDLVHQWLESHKLVKSRPMANKTVQDYRYAAEHVLTAGIAEQMPCQVTVADVKAFLTTVAVQHGRGAAKHARAVLAHALEIAVDSSGKGGSTDMHTAINPTLGASNSIPDVTTRKTTLDHSRAPTTREAATLLWRLYHDPEAEPMGDTRRKGGVRGSRAAIPNGKDIADLIAFLFSTGARLGEALAVRWSDLDLSTAIVTITGTVTYLKGAGTVRQDRTKTVAGKRDVPLASRTVAMLRRRAQEFRIDLGNAPALPVFGSPQIPDRFRDPNNLTKDIRRLFDRYDVPFGRSHLGRKYRVTSLFERNVPLNKIADLVGHTNVATTMGYLGRASRVDDQVREAL